MARYLLQAVNGPVVDTRENTSWVLPAIPEDPHYDEYQAAVAAGDVEPVSNQETTS